MQNTIQLAPDNFPQLAAAIVDAHYRVNPQLAQAYGSDGKQKCLDDAVIHLTYLQQAVENDSDSLFIDYALWAKQLFEGINLPISHLIEHLDVMSDVLRNQLDIEQAQTCSRIINAAKDSLSDEDHTKHTFLTDDLPSIELARQYLELLLNADRSGASQLILNVVKNQQLDVQQVYLNVFQPCQREVGLLWQTGKISVAQEHFCTAATQLCMSQLYPFIFGSPKNGKVAVITCAQGELHEIGVRMVADLLEMNGWDAFYLGANTPVESVLSFVSDKQPDLIGISATITANLPQVKTLISKIRQQESRKSAILVGGYPFNVSANLFQEVGADACSSDAKDAIKLANQLV